MSDRRTSVWWLKATILALQITIIVLTIVVILAGCAPDQPVRCDTVHPNCIVNGERP